MEGQTRSAVHVLRCCGCFALRLDRLVRIGFLLAKSDAHAALNAGHVLLGGVSVDNLQPVLQHVRLIEGRAALTIVRQSDETRFEAEKERRSEEN
uniref:Uncharacterized protein n=1 Tax=Peronospora matthiolae TaxID=2874970 RepID=A0AAV1VEJ6_9STRA